MPIYKYRTRSEDGKVMTGAVEAVSESEAADLLADRGLVVLALSQTNLKASGKGFNINIGRIRQKDLVIFSRQLSVMMSATVPIVQALRILSQQTPNPILIDKIVEMANDVDGGMKLSSAMAKHTKIFSRFYVSMVRSGETSGKLDEVLEYLANQMEKDYDLVSRIKGAMIYPAFIVFAMVAVAFLMMTFVIPRMTNLLIESGVELPLLTRILIATSNFFARFWILVILGLVGAFLLFRMWTRSKSGRVIWDRTKIHFPIFGSFFRRIYIVRFTRSLSTLIRGGVPISIALRVTAEVVDNYAYQELILETVREVEGGNSISTLFNRSELMPKMLTQMMNIGERTGKLDTVLDKLADFYSREVDNSVQGLTSLIEPMILIVMGVGVGAMVAAIMLPMFKIAQSIS